MYHYVRDSPKTYYRGINALTTKDFIAQVDYLLKNYSMISLEEYAKFLNNDRDIPDNSCILTFDDGFKDHFVNVFPILRDRKISASFFPITQTLDEFVIPDVHKIHLLLSKIGPMAFAKEFNQLLETEFQELADKYRVDTKVRKMEKRFDTILATNIKAIVALVPLKERTKILNLLFSSNFGDEKGLCKELYLSSGEIKEMIGAGMNFGGHSHTHPFLTRLPKEEQAMEIKVSKEILERKLKTKIDMFSYPYGKFNNDTIEILKEQGFVCAVIDPSVDIGINEGKVNPFTLRRLDTNDLPKR